MTNIQGYTQPLRLTSGSHSAAGCNLNTYYKGSILMVFEVPTTSRNFKR